MMMIVMLKALVLLLRRCSGVLISASCLIISAEWTIVNVKQFTSTCFSDLSSKCFLLSFPNGFSTVSFLHLVSPFKSTIQGGFLYCLTVGFCRQSRELGFLGGDIFQWKKICRVLQYVASFVYVCSFFVCVCVLWEQKSLQISALRGKSSPKAFLRNATKSERCKNRSAVGLTCLCLTSDASEDMVNICSSINSAILL